MKTGNAIILVAALVLVVLVGIVAAEDFMMPQETEIEETISINNSTDNATPPEHVKKHVPPKGVMQKVILIFWDPFGHAPIDPNGLKIYNGAIWYQYPGNTWIQVAFINQNKQVNHIQTWDQNIVNVIKNNYPTTENVTITMVEQPPANNTNQATITDNTNTTNTTSPEKINTTINLNDQKLTNDTNTTIKGKIVDENGTAISNAEVTITVNGQSSTQTTDSNGQFTYEYNTETSDLNIGSNSMQVSYSGNQTYNGNTKTITITLKAIEEETNDTTETTESDSYTDSSSNNNKKSHNSTDTYPSDDYYAETYQ